MEVEGKPPMESVMFGITVIFDVGGRCCCMLFEEGVTILWGFPGDQG
jgi:hypothetical protein